MDLTVLSDHETIVEARLDREQVLVDPDALVDAIGWELKTEGLCRNDVCVPLRESIEGDDETVDLAAVARTLGQRLVLDHAGPVVALADDPMARGEVRNLHTLSLPDVDGRDVDLSGLAGKKTILIAWASW